MRISSAREHQHTAMSTLRSLLIRALRAPGALYEWHLGWLLGRRFLRLTHRGRQTGRHYQTMLEVIGEGHATRELFVMAGLGHHAQWYRNTIAGGAVQIAIGHERFPPLWRQLEPTDAAAVLMNYEQRNKLLAPIVRATLSTLIGWRYDGSPEARDRLVR